jgi:hypothetical protein
MVGRSWDKAMAKTAKRVFAALYLLVVVLVWAGPCDSRPPKSNEDWRGLHWAAVMGDAALTAKLIKEGANVNKVDSRGHATPLGVAANGGHVEIAKLLMDNGADVNKECPCCSTGRRSGTVMPQLRERGRGILPRSRDARECHAQARRQDTRQDAVST